MKISGVIFADGKIIDCAISGDAAKVHLIDYMQNRFVLQLAGAVVEYDANNFGCSVHHHKLKRIAEGWALELFDDDNEKVFSARFSAAKVIYPQGS